MGTTPWGSLIRTLNKELAVEEVTLGDLPIKLKVRSRTNADGSRLVDAVGLWNTHSSKVTTRSTDVAIGDGDFARKLPQAYDRAVELVKAHNAGIPTKQVRTSEPADLASAKPASVLAVQMKKVQKIIDRRKQPNQPGRKCRDNQYEIHIKHKRIIESHLSKSGEPLSMASISSALIAHYQDTSKKNYRDAIVMWQGVIKELDLSLSYPEERLPTYKYIPKEHDIPADDVIAERLMAIEDPYERQFVYACVAYGRRNSELWHANWDYLQEEAPWKLPVFAPKNGKSGVSWVHRFSDEEISLKGFRPPEWDELQSVFKLQTDPIRAARIAALARDLSNLIKDRLGCEATALRHRWGIVGLTNPKVKADPLTLAKAMCTSYQMFDQTYTKELAIYQMSNDFNPVQV